MLYLVDANVLIQSKNQYYEFDRIRQYWDWIEFQANAGNLKMPFEIYREINAGDDELAEWAKTHKKILTLDEEVNAQLLEHVVQKGYGSDLTDTEVQAIGQDPFLIAYAFLEPRSRTVATNEVKSNAKREKRRIPSVCADLNVLCCNQWELHRHLDFRIANT